MCTTRIYVFNLLLLHGLHPCSRSLYWTESGRLTGLYWAERFNCSVNDCFMVVCLSLFILAYIHIIQSAKLHTIAWLSWGSLLWFGTVRLPYQACYLATSWTTLFRMLYHPEVGEMSYQLRLRLIDPRLGFDPHMGGQLCSLKNWCNPKLN